MLSPIEQTFVEAYALNGQNGTEAYLEANPDVSRASAGTLANRLLKKVEIQKAIQRLRQPREKAVVLSLERKRAILCEMAEDTDQETRDRIKAIETDAKLAGEFEEKVDMKVEVQITKSW